MKSGAACGRHLLGIEATIIVENAFVKCFYSSLNSTIEYAMVWYAVVK